MFKQKNEEKTKSEDVIAEKDRKHVDPQKAEEQPVEKTEKKEEEKEKPESKSEQKEKSRIKELETKLDELNDKLTKTMEALAKEKDDYVRLMADLDNLRRHSAEEKLALVDTASSDTIKGLLPVLDDCERAMAILKDSSDQAAKDGTELIYNKLFGYLKTKGLEVIEAKGEKFDTEFHEAVTQFPVEDKDKKGKVVDVIQTGYKLKGKVLRYAKVVVGA